VEERGEWLVAWFEEPQDPEAFVAAVPEALARETGLVGVALESGWQAHEDWAENWKRGLGERRLTDRIVVHPSWVTPSDVRPGDVVVTLDPGMAFGTAEHGTTRGCIRLLDTVVRQGDRILDVGAGSGILSIVAAGLGAQHVRAIEGDPLACEAMGENVELNASSQTVHVDETYATSASLSAAGPVSGIVANIETGILAPLFPGFARAVEDGGWLIVSGILEHEWAGARSDLEAEGFLFERVDEDGIWRSGLFRRPRVREE
jgi:ribosomal protein L11 methyltransferase